MEANPSLGAIRFRAMGHVDLESVMKIETQSYEFPWSRGTFEDCLAAPYECWAVELGDREGRDRIVGYGILHVSDNEAHLLNVCVGKQLRGSGFGREIVLYLVDRAKAQRATKMFLEVRPSNGIARALYDSVGFHQIGVRKGYYPAFSGREDGLVLALHLDAE